MGKIVLFIILVTLGIFAVVSFSGSSSTTTLPQQLDPLSPSPEAMQQKDNQASSAASQQITPSMAVASVEEPVSATQAAIMTSKGEIVIDLDFAQAPNTVRNFVNKIKSGFYKGLTFHRVEDWVVQGGDPVGNGTGGGNIPVEFNNKPFVVGSLGVASRGDNKVQNDAQFFITKKDASWLNGKYTNFGIVSTGMDVAQKIAIGDKILDITLK